MKEREVREGLEVELHRRLPCSVSFTRGQERSVQFAIVGLPQVVCPFRLLRLSGLCGCHVAVRARLAMVGQYTRQCPFIEKALARVLPSDQSAVRWHMAVCTCKGTRHWLGAPQAVS